MSWPEHTVETFEEFVDYLKGLMPSESTANRLYWFRGQSNATWDLEPSLMRSLGDSDLLPEGVVDLEDEALKLFRSKAHFFVSPPLLAKVHTKPCWWALMQHHGAPTRLLDWTISPYVAAYFALHQDGGRDDRRSTERDSKSAGPKDGAVWCFCSKTLRKRFEGSYGQPPDFDSIDAPAWYQDKLQHLSEKRVVIPLAFDYASSERIAAQQGRFTMCFKVRQQHNCVIEQIGENNVLKLLIPHAKKREFLLRLRDMNITGSALFPGVDGLGQSVKEFVSLGSHYTQVARTEARSGS